MELVELIVRIAGKKGVTPPQLTLAWLMAQGDDVVPIPGTTKAARLEENLGALKVALTPGEEREIRAACERAEIRGERYPGPANKALFGDTPPLKA